MEEDTDHDVKQAAQQGDTQTFIQPFSERGSSIDSTSALAHRPEFSIRCWPLQSQWKRTTAILVSYLAGGLLVYQFSAEVLVSILITLTLILVSWRLWVPIWYRVGPSGIIHSVWGYQRQLGWAHIRRIRQDKRGVLVFYDREPSLHSILQSFYILADGENLEPLLTAMDYYLAGRVKKNS